MKPKLWLSKKTSRRYDNIVNKKSQVINNFINTLRKVRVCVCVSHYLYILQSFENLWLQFNKLNENVTENYSTSCVALSHVSDICDSTTNDVLHSYTKSVEKNEDLQQKIGSDVDALKCDVESGMQKVKFVPPFP